MYVWYYVVVLCFLYNFFVFNCNSYKEESEDGIDFDDLVEVNYDIIGEYVEDDRECIERVFISRVGRLGEIGVMIIVYVLEYEELQKYGEFFYGEFNEI